MVRVLVVGPGDDRSAAIEETLRGRGHSVVTASDLGHATLLQRMFKPDVVFVPRLMLAHERETLTTTPPTPVVLFVDLQIGGQITTVADGVARVLPARPTQVQLDGLLTTPLGKERAVGRIVGQLGLAGTTGTVALHVPGSGGDLLGELVVQNGKVIETRRGPDLRTLLAREGPVAASFRAGIVDEVVAEDDFSFGFDDEDDAEPLTVIAPELRTAAAAKLGPIRVLLADDDRDLLRFTATYLRGQGFEVETAVDGEDALHTAARQLPDVIVADARMAGTSGWDLLALVRSRVRLRETPVVLTGYDGAWTARLQASGCGADGVVEKGMRPERLVSMITKVVAPTRDVAVAIEAARISSPIDARLRGSGPHTLLRLLAAQRFSGRVTVAVGEQRFLLALSEGDLVFTRVTVGGRTQMHREAIAALLQVGSVGFTLMHETGLGRPRGTLDEVIATAAVALDEVADAAYADALAEGQQLVVRSELLAAYRLTCGLEARPIVDQIASGRDVRDLLNRGVDPMLLDGVVHDLFRKGAVRAW
jgi:CheY-like chemotaxis protein